MSISTKYKYKVLNVKSYLQVSTYKALLINFKWNNSNERLQILMQQQLKTSNMFIFFYITQTKLKQWFPLGKYVSDRNLL